MKLVIFDCDGTLVDSQHLIVAAMNAAFEGLGRDLLPRETVLSIVGLSLPLAIERLAPDATRDEVAALTTGYKDAFAVLRQDPDAAEPLYPGLREILDWLHDRDDVILGIATGKSRRGVDRLIAHHGLEGRFETINTADEHPSKPHPAMITNAMWETDARPEATVMIGDTSYDIEMARTAGVHAVGVSWGYHPVSELRRAGAHVLVEEHGGLARALSAHLELEGWTS